MSRGGSAAALAKKIEEGTLPTSNETLHTGSKIVWSKHDGEYVPVICGWHEHQGKRERPLKITSVLSMRADSMWTGYCQPCGRAIADLTRRHEKRTGKWELADGYVDFDDRDDKGRPLNFCNICQTSRYKPAPYYEGATGRCRKCQKLVVGDVTHPSGAVVHRGMRDPRNRERVVFTCSNPECCPSCGQTHYVYLAHTLAETWTGRCVECFEKLPHPNQNQGTENVGCLNAVLDWDDRDDNGKIAIACPFSWCGKKWYAELSTITNGKKDPDWLACCPEHYRGKSALLLVVNNSNSLASHGDQNDNGQENSNVKKLRSPRRSNQTDKTPTVLGKTIEDLNRVILEIYDNLQVNSAVTETKAAYKLGLGRPKYGDEGHENIRRLLRRNKVQDKFPHYRDKIIAKHRSSTAYAIEEETTPQFNRRA